MSNYISDDPPRVLPWTPKVRQKDLDTFLDYTRMKFVGFTLKVIYCEIMKIFTPKRKYGQKWVEFPRKC